LQSPIESCYVWADFQLNFLAKKAPGGRSLDTIIYGGSFGGIVGRVAKEPDNNQSFGFC